jgi:hypothetical protein
MIAGAGIVVDVCWDEGEWIAPAPAVLSTPTAPIAPVAVVGIDASWCVLCAAGVGGAVGGRDTGPRSSGNNGSNSGLLDDDAGIEDSACDCKVYEVPAAC